MSKTLAHGGVVTKTTLAIAIATALLFVAAVAYVSQVAAVAPADYGLKEGDVVSAAGSDDPDVYIVNELGYKRLFLNPAIFGFYGHLGGFAAVKNVSPATRDAFPTSGLFRNCETNDEKVYGVETTGEDTGMLHWVNTSGAQAVADDPNFFKKVFCINNNEFNWYSKGSDYSSVNQVPNYVRVPGATPTPTGPLSVALAPDSPSAKTITLNATGVEFLKVRFSGSGTLNTMTLKRLGAGETNDFSNVYIYDGAKRLVSGKTFSSSSGEVTFLISVAVSGTKDLSVVADMDSTNNTAGNVNYIQLMGVTATGTVSGTPLNGNNVTSSGASSGSVTVVRSGSLSNPTVGQKAAEISEFKITANTEAASVRRLTLINGGTVKPSDITNLKLTTGTSEWAGSMTSDGYAVFSLGTGYNITKGGNAVFKVWADLAGKKDETLDFYFENDADTYAVGDQYGQGMAVTDTDIDQASDVTDLTLQGGVLTIAFNGPNATNIATNATDVTLLRYSVTAASNIEVRKTEFVLCASTDGSTDTTFEDASDETEWDDLTDIKVWNEDTNQVVMGPKDGTAFNDANDTDSCPDAQSGALEAFTDVIDLSAGQTYHFKVTGDFDTSLGGFLDAEDIVRIVLDKYTEDTPDITVMKYSGTNTSVADADIVPNADVSGPNFTLKGSSLTLGLSSSPADRTYIKGTTGTEFVGITFAAALGSGLKVTDITLTGYVEDESGDTHNEGVDTNDSGVSIANAVSQVSLYDAASGALLSNTPSSNQLSVINTGTVKFSNLNWVLAAGETRTLLVKANLSTNDASGSNGDRYAFDINATTDVTALDDSNNTVNAGNADPNGATAPTVDITVKNAGNLTVAAAPDTPTKSAAYWGQTGVDFSKFRFTATDEGHYLERLNFNTGDTAAQLVANVNAVSLTYKNKAGSTLTANGAFNTDGSVSFAFTGDNRPYVPADSSLDVTVKADMKTKAQGATNNVNFSIDFSGGAADEFRAVGASGTVMDGADSDIVNRAPSDNQYVYRVFPKITKVTDSSYESNSTVLNPTESEVLRFTVEAMGLSDSKLLFDNEAAGSGSIKFDTVASGVGVAADPTFKIYDAADGSSVDVDGTITNAPNPSVGASITFNFTSKDIEISGGQSKTFYMRVNLSDFSHNGDYFQVILRDDEAGLINWVANSSGATSDADTASSTGVLRQLELIGTTKVRNI
ncbi:MAG: hypothetical protein HY506_02490 [Candidatus Yanofskybacteria bacterium]|nr:hypothetical protein [Candidatus Yanofskybacteria bacterium]